MMDIDRIMKLTKEIDDQLVHLTEGNEHQKIIIRRATKAIRDELPKPQKKCVPINWSAVMGK